MNVNPIPAGLLAEAERLFMTRTIPENGHAAAEGAAAALSIFLPSEASDDEYEEAMNEALARLTRKHPQLTAGALASLMKTGACCRADEAFASMLKRYAERDQS